MNDEHEELELTIEEKAEDHLAAIRHDVRGIYHVAMLFAVLALLGLVLGACRALGGEPPTRDKEISDVKAAVATFEARVKDYRKRLEVGSGSKAEQEKTREKLAKFEKLLADWSFRLDWLEERVTAEGLEAEIKDAEEKIAKLDEEKKAADDERKALAVLKAKLEKVKGWDAARDF